jgi:hypothetical protein
MKQTSDEFKITPGGGVVKYLGLLMAVVYIGVGGLIIMGPSAQFNIPDKYTLPLGSLLLAYGLFRGYRVYAKYFTK